MFACVYGTGVCDPSALVELAYGFSPKVEETAPDTVVFDLEGCEMLFGSPREIARAIALRAFELKRAGKPESDEPINVAIASNPDAAIHAARAFNGVTVIPPGEELNRLGDLPVKTVISGQWPVAGGHKVVGSRQKAVTRNRKAATAVLPTAYGQLPTDIFETLESWGIRTFRELAALPEAGVAGRLGPLGTELQKLARGAGTRPLLLKKPPPVFEKSLELDDPVDLLEPLAFIMSRLLNQLCAALTAHAMAASELKLRLRLEDRTEIERVLRLPIAMRDPRIFLKLLMLDVESHPPQSAVIAVSIAAEPAPPRSLQKGLFQPIAPEPEKLELTMARLTRLVGADNFGSPELMDTHRPDAFRMRRFKSVASGQRSAVRRQKSGVIRQESEAGKVDSSIRNPTSKIQNLRSSILNSQSSILNPQFFMGFRVFRPPLRARVEAESGRPTRISARNPGRAVNGKVVQSSGPWRSSGEWWMEDKWDRAEWDVLVGSSALLYRVYQELETGEWFVEGMYD